MVLSIIADKITADHNMTLSAELDNFASAVRLVSDGDSDTVTLPALDS